MKYVIIYAAMLSGVVAALLGLRAATVRVRNSQHYFMESVMEDITLQSRWATWTAIAAAASTLLQALERYFF